jgi:hypothetical protein
MYWQIHWIVVDSWESGDENNAACQKILGNN